MSIVNHQPPTTDLHHSSIISQQSSVNFLLKRKIAIVVAFLAMAIVGTVAFFNIPVSLLPDIDIPQITVTIAGGAKGARELENTVTAPLRRQLLQTGGLDELRSETRDGAATIRMHFDYGVDTDLAFIEVNEKIDATMNSLPRDIRRPTAIKASATDIPVIYLHMTLRDNTGGDFLAMADLAENVVRRRIEQLPEITMADMTGVPPRTLLITPDRDLMASAGITISDIEQALTENNAEPGTMTVRDGQYEYNINISNCLRTPDDVKDIYLRKGERLLQLGDFCDVAVTADRPQGYTYYDGKRSVTFAIIKQPDESMSAMKRALDNTVAHFKREYPEIEFTTSRNQTELLDFTISNLVQNLVIGFMLVFVLTSIFMREVRSAAVIGLTIITSVVITFLLFYLFGVSVNIISLSGLILAVGMMIDNSVIVTENITQMRQRGASLDEACTEGTSEMITPMLSSSLTTVAVFVPLIFLSGIAGAIFYDQAFAITAGLAVSYITAIMLLPVLYRIIFAGSRPPLRRGEPDGTAERFYTAVLNRCMAYRWVCLTATVLTIPACVVLFGLIQSERMPNISRSDMIMRIDWNENISLDENARRTAALTAALDTAALLHNTASTGIQDYMLDASPAISASEAEIYLLSRSPHDLSRLTASADSALCAWPRASARYMPADNIFEKIFSTNDPQLEARLHTPGRTPDPDSLIALEQRLGATSTTPMRERISLVADRHRLLIYHISYQEVTRALRTAFRANTAGTLRSNEQYLPVTIAGDDKSVERVLAETLVKGVPLASLVSIRRDRDLRSITAGADGEYTAIAFDVKDDPDAKIASISDAVSAAQGWEVSFAGSLFANRRMLREMVVILLVSVMLMYFILCAQFGSFVQPLIVLAEIPVDTAFALMTLMVCGQTLNLMSAIGIIVTCGIVVNDSILKLDAINDLRASGMPLYEAIHTAGVRRMRAIIMTSLTTILAMVPMLWTDDMGSELQRPLAIAVTGSMVMGTLVSIFVIPVIYRIIYSHTDR